MLADYSWEILEQEKATIELSYIGQILADGGVEDNNYLCGSCSYTLASNIPKNFEVLPFETVKCPKCKKVNKIKWNIHS
jgi:hypothetical protein